MALYTETCTVVRTDAGLCESFEVKVGLHHGSILSPLFAAVMDVVSSEAISGLPSELLYDDDLLRMAPTMEQLSRRVAKWRAGLLDKGLKVNAGMSKVMVGISGGKMIVNSGPVGKECRQTLFRLQTTQPTRGGAVTVVWQTLCKLCPSLPPPAMGA